MSWGTRQLCITSVNPCITGGTIKVLPDQFQSSPPPSPQVVLDVGAGSGILSFFAVQAGARKVYAIEASSMAVHCQQLVKSNGLAEKITVIAGKLEEVYRLTCIAFLIMVPA